MAKAFLELSLHNNPNVRFRLEDVEKWQVGEHVEILFFDRGEGSSRLLVFDVCLVSWVLLNEDYTHYYDYDGGSKFMHKLHVQVYYYRARFGIWLGKFGLRLCNTRLMNLGRWIDPLHM